MLTVTGLCKSFGGKLALHDVTFEVKRGEIHGLLGHNGAGKSTTLGIILGMVEPDRGEATIGGISVQKDHAGALRQVGAIFESPAFYDIVGPVCESADFIAKQRRLAAAEGDLLAVMSSGAYGMSMSSNYNSRPRAAEVLVDGDRAHLVRRRESVEQLFALECIPG